MSNKSKKRKRAKTDKRLKKPQATQVPMSMGQTYQYALQNFRNGKLLEAEKLCRQILDKDPDHADTNHLLGVIVAQQWGKNDLAIELIKKALSKNSNPEFYKNLGLIFKKSGKTSEAISSYRKALSLKHDYAEVYSNLGSVYFDLGRFEDSINHFHKALAIEPNNAKVYGFLGIVQGRSGKREEAIISFKKALSINPDNHVIYNNLGNILLELDRDDEAVDCFKKSISLKNNYETAHYNLGIVFQKLGKWDAAITSFRTALSIKPDYIGVHNRIGQVLLKTGRTAESITSFKKELAINPDNASTYNNLGIAFQEVDKIEEAVSCFKKATLLNPDFFQAYSNLGLALQELNKLNEAIESFKAALEINPEYAVSHYNYAIALHELGEMDRALCSYKKALSLNPDYAKAYRGVSQITKHSERDEVTRRMEDLYAKDGLGSDERMHLGFALGKVFEDLREYGRAFDFILEANRLKRGSYEYSIEDDVLFFERIKKTFSDNFFSSRHVPGKQDKTPIFILGMPRSGTTLVEQILSSHPQVFGAGELAVLTNLVNDICLKEKQKQFPECMTELDGAVYERMGQSYLDELRKYSEDARHITDKMPHNFLFVGLIKIILPEAKVIHCMRNPMDNCLSIFKNLFRREGSHKYANDLTELGRYYKLYRGLMAHWEKVLPGFMYTLRYEEMVSDQETQTKRLLKFCDIPWDEACLDFHKTERRVKTASFAQVRQPIYKDSVELWKRYETQLEPLQKEISA